MSARSSTPTQTSIQGALEMNGQQFPFYLKCCTYDLGPAGPVNYYYMPISRLRSNDATQEVSNFRSSIGFWYAAMQQAGFADDPVQQANYVMAVAYALVNRDKGAQRIYRDAMLRPRSFRPERLALSPEVRTRVQRAVASRDRDEVLREMDVALGAAQLSDGDRIATARAMDHWVNRGVLQFCAHGREGLRAWLAEVDEWIRRFRKRSNGRMRTFLDVFAAECKLSFYLCYSNFWIGILRWLEDNHKLDAMSGRFLRVWHHQNRSVEVTHGQTPAGIIYPTTGGRILLLPGKSGAFELHKVSSNTKHIGPEVIPNPFRGHILALHQLNWILLSRPELREQVGRCISSPRFDSAMRDGRVDAFPEYWQLVDAIVTAAYLYQHAYLESESRRSFRQSKRQPPSVGRATEFEFPPDLLFKEFVDSLLLRCPCGGAQRYTAADVPAADGDVVTIPVVCKGCGLESPVTIERRNLQRFLLRNR